MRTYEFRVLLLTREFLHKKRDPSNHVELNKNPILVASCCVFLRIRLNTEVPIQVDGEPWVQSPCEVVVLRSALKATMLRKSKMKRRNTEPVLASTTDKTAPDE
ncbi:diacylglycerol kinase [Trichonephila clavata]|uniref:Diacylglycerol kinase n=1 Tax=Trichonephila clavata TaxID=2740835 RepID=A0A8X6FR28_TRICU|nr:diacylglycerol kinase [Trichonephila clavata]